MWTVLPKVSPSKILYHTVSLASYCVLLWKFPTTLVDSSLCIWDAGKFSLETLFWQVFILSSLPDAFLVLSSDTEQSISLFCVLVIGFKLLNFGPDLEGTVDDTSSVRRSGEMCSAESLFWETWFESEVVLLGIVTGLSSILPVAVTPVVVVVVSVLVVVLVVVAVACYKSAKAIANVTAI